MYCKYCGKETPDASDYCQNCGANIIDNMTEASIPVTGGNRVATTPATIRPSLHGFRTQKWYKDLRLTRIFYLITLGLLFGSLYPLINLYFSVSTKEIELKYLLLNYFLPIVFNYYFIAAFLFWIIFLWKKDRLKNIFPNFVIAQKDYLLYRKKMIKEVVSNLVIITICLFFGFSIINSAISFYNSYQHLASMGEFVLFLGGFFILAGFVYIVLTIQLLKLIDPEKTKDRMMGFMIYLFPYWLKCFKKGIIVETINE